MTEIEWHECDTPTDLLQFLRPKLTQRKSRLILCASARFVWDQLIQDVFRQCVEQGEEFAEGKVAREALESVYTRSCSHRSSHHGLTHAEKQARTLARSVAVGCASAYDISFAWLKNTLETTARIKGWLAAVEVPAWDLQKGPFHVGRRRAEEELCSRIRELTNPFCRTPNKSKLLQWQGGVVRTIAEQIYHESRFEEMPILGDALEEAGCEDRTILDHCRSSEPHLPGCWVLDHLLDRDVKDAVAATPVATTIV